MEPRPERPRGRFATRAVTGSLAPVDVPPGLAPAIHPAVAWSAEETAELGARLDDQVPGYVYGRYDNPTVTGLNNTFAALHDADAAWALASGTAAIHSILTIMRGAGRILVTSRLYGGTWALLRRLEKETGLTVDEVDATDPRAFAAALEPEHDLAYVETIANPTTAITDLGAIAAACREQQTPLVVDNTFASVALCRPLAHGATVVIESATKFLAGHGDVVAGLLAGPDDIIREVRRFAYETGAMLGPFDAWLVSRGIQTLPLRIAQSCRSATAIAAAASSHAAAPAVHHPSVSSHPQHHLSLRQLDDHGAVLAIDLADRERAERFADALDVFQRATTLGASRSVVLHPASTSHRQLDEVALAAAGLGPGLVRMSAGIEDTDDLVEDVVQALDRLA